jgi:hypothetical protein
MYRLGPELFDLLNAKQRVGNMLPVIYGAPGLSPAEINVHRGPALNIARKDFETWPKLLPISGHRFLAAEPCRPGNPVFSIMQTDIIYYGADLAHYLVNEFIDHDYALHTNPQEIQKIRIWSYLAEDWNWQLDDR